MTGIGKITSFAQPGGGGAAGKTIRLYHVGPRFYLVKPDKTWIIDNGQTFFFAGNTD